MTEAEQRQSVLDEAMSWLNTPHHNGARIKGVGVDCGQFPIAVYSTVGLMPALETGRYPSDFHLHVDLSLPIEKREWYLKFAQENGREFVGPPNPGDFMLCKVGRSYSHGAIVIKWPQIIHAVFRVGVILDDGEQGMFNSKHVKDRKFFTLWGE